MPKASFCIATFQKPEHLKKTIQSMLDQSVSDFEIVVSDNDPAESSRPAVESFRDNRLRYFANEDNLGMIKNFNAALKRAEGEFVIVNTDDDPPEPNFLEHLFKLEADFPGRGCYFGATRMVIESEEARARWGGRNRIVPMLGPWPENSAREWAPEHFPFDYLENKVFPAVLWSSGMIRRSVVEKIGGVPDYGSPELADTYYTLLAGLEKGFVAVNTVISSLVIHESNNSLKHTHFLKPMAVDGYQFFTNKLSTRPDFKKIKPLYEKFLQNAVIYKATLIQTMGSKNWSPKEKTEFNALMAHLFSQPHIRSGRWKYKTKLLMMKNPFLYKGFRKIKETLRRQKRG